MNIATHPQLSKALADALENGPIPFRRFMELALYHPQGGYYCQENPRIGPDGDFYTSPHQSSWLGRMIAPLIGKIRRNMGDPPSFPLWEFGPGEGWLAVDILESIRSSQAASQRALVYTLAEQSAQARGRIREKLQDSGEVRFADAAQYPPAGFEGVVLAHEFLDALPVHALIQKNQGMKERYVARRGERLHFSEGALSDERLCGWFSGLGIPLSTGQTAEVNLCAFDWVSEVARRMERGALLVFDYGFSARVLYGRGRPDGALRGYRSHTLVSDVLTRPGETDITTHVDFTSILRAAASHGMELAGFTDQARFLLGAGLSQALESMSGEDDEQTRRERRSIMGIMDPTGLGGAIKVMLLSKNLGLRDLSEFSMKPDDRESLETLFG
ncbi:MAG: SAM-dependent methyltransferase [Nitrospinae bacterium]|nr:SAM-dependent methyltransferase [Nitrospinota bacterium]